MIRSTLTALALLVPLAVPAAAQEVEYGSVAVIPFRSAIHNAQALESARILSRFVEEGLRESGRFMAVLERSPEMDAAISAELENAESGESFESAIRINTESQMNAKYLVDGYIQRYEITPRPNSNYYDAQVDLRIRIVDVETGAVLVSDVVEITNEILNNQTRGGGGLGGLVGGFVSEAVGSTDATPQEAINHVHENAAAAIKTMLEDEVSLLLVDYDVDAEDRVSELILLRAPDLEKGEELIVKFNARNRMGGGFRRQDIGKARIERVDSEYAYAEITEGRGEITEAIHEDPYRVIVLPGGDG